MARYAVAADIHQARTLPGSFYRDPEVFEAQRQGLFVRTWHLCPRGELPSSGGQQPWTLLPDVLDEPLLLSHDGEALRLLSNVCTHRGALLVSEGQQSPVIRCPYHGRRFSLGGQCLSSPGLDEAADFPAEFEHLTQVAIHQQGPLLFASLDPMAPLDRQLEPLLARTSWLPWERLALDPAACRRYRFAAHWALYVDNYLEGLHIPFVHPSLTGALDLGRYRIELFDGVSLQLGAAAEDEPVFEPPPGHPDHGQRIGGYYFFLFPCTMINVYPWGLSVNVVLPRGLADTEVQYLTWVWDPSLREQGVGAGLEQVELEDEAIVERVQRGIGSRLYDRGRYAPEHERAVHHFHQLLCADLFGLHAR